MTTLDVRESPLHFPPAQFCRAEQRYFEQFSPVKYYAEPAHPGGYLHGFQGFRGFPGWFHISHSPQGQFGSLLRLSIRI